MLLLCNVGFSQVNPNGPDYVTVYIETGDMKKIGELQAELESYSNKVVSTEFNTEVHEFTVYYTPLMRDDTIYQIIFKYFENIKKVRGTHIISNE